MGYAALYSLARDLDEILDDLHIDSTEYSNDDEQPIMTPQKPRIELLHENIVYLLTLLENHPREARVLEARLANATDQVNDLFHHLQILDNQEVFGELNSENFCKELERLVADFDFIREEAMQIKSITRTPMSSICNGNIVGIEEDLLEIKNRLHGGPSELHIVPIVGMGGIGKSTLAKHAYDDPSNAHHFDVRVWVTVSQNYNLRRILQSILSCMREDGCRLWNKELMKLNVYRYLKGRRFLVVVDDVWDTNVWDDLQRVFPDDSIGSRIIITTREFCVASYVVSLSQHHVMRLLTVDQSWGLLKQKVFGPEDCPRELEKIGELIAQKRRGLPLAIVVIGGVLSKLNKSKESWEKIARNVCEVMNTNDEILALSYMHLPPHLKPCFLYMGCFQEGHEINASKIIRLWGAEGFLISNDTKEMEELGYEYLEDLVQRSLVLIEKKRHNDEIKAIKIHDILRDLCLRKSRDENFLLVISDFSGSFPEGIEMSRRLSICCNVSGCFPNMETAPIHTLLHFKHWAFDSWRSFRLLRVVDGLCFLSIPSSSITYISELFHLRYLSLTCESIRRTLTLVSESLYQLQNLRTLIVRIVAEIICYFFYDEDLHQPCLKLEIWRMPQLRHVILLDGFLPDISPESSQEISSLPNLHTLSRVKDLKCSETLLKMIPNFKKLGIIYSYNATYEPGWSSYYLTNLVHLQKLEKLSFYASKHKK